MNHNLPCPACGFETLEDMYGSYILCDICNWEDDSVQLANPCSRGGANHYSLEEYQVKNLKLHPLEEKVCKGIPRSLSWRPLNEVEISKYNKQLENEAWPNKAVLSESDAYWRTSS